MLVRLIQYSSPVLGWPIVGPFLARQRCELETLWSRNDVPLDVVREFTWAREQTKYLAAFDEKRPLVSICVGTYNRSELLISRCLRSLAAQTYDNLEIIVVGDCCTDDTPQAVAALGDSRFSFVNLPERGPYPEDPRLRWMVAGTMPFNHALRLATGQFITHLDDDDEHAPDRVEKLLRFAQEQRADLVFHPFDWERTQGRWRVNQAVDFRHGQVTTSSIFYHSWLKRIPWDLAAYRYREPGDWNRLRKIRYLGARIARYPESLLRHYRERLQRRL